MKRLSKLLLAFAISKAAAQVEFIPEYMQNGFTWDKAKPSEKLNYVPCFEGGYQCARLLVPLDYKDKNLKRHATIAIVKLPAEIDGGHKNETWGGPVFFNPGGPGGFGIGSFINSVANEMRNLFPNHDLISFDPRGVGYTTPNADCYENPISRDIFNGQKGVRAFGADGEVNFNEVAALYRGGTMKCAYLEDAQYMGTAATARDLARMSDFHWEAAGKKGGLQYWGVSYGTFLGVTFATLFPDKVGRMILDANVDPYDFSSGAIKTMTEDADAALNKVFEYCAKSDKCALNPTGKVSAKDIEKRYNRVLEKIRKNPIPALGSSYNEAGYFNYADLKGLTTTSLYAPMVIPGLMQYVDELDKGDISQNIPSTFAPRPYYEPTPLALRFIESKEAIMCGDLPRADHSYEELRKDFEWGFRQSKAAGENRMIFKISCNGWNHTATEVVTKFGARTKNPILFIGNTYDCATPLSSTIKNNKLFPGSSYLVLDAIGHGVSAVPSKCVHEHMKSYMSEGKLPRKGKVCKPDVESPFDRRWPWELELESDLRRRDDGRKKEGWDHASMWKAYIEHGIML